MMQKCHRGAIHVEAGGHASPGMVGRAWAVGPRRPLCRGCWGMSLSEMGIDGGVMDVREAPGPSGWARLPHRQPDPSMVPQAWFTSEVPFLVGFAMLGSAPLRFCPKAQAGAAPMWNPETQGQGERDGRNHGCTGHAWAGRMHSTCREGLPEMADQRHATESDPSCPVGTQIATL